MAELKLLQLTITKVDGPVFSGEVLSVSVPGADGDMTLLANHEPLISPLRPGTITLTKADNSTETYPVTTGTLEISNNHATILL